MLEVSETLLLPVSVTFGSDRQTLDGRLVSADRTSARIELLETAPAGFVAGTGVTITVESRRHLEVVGVVRSCEDTRVIIDVSRTGHREERWSPRERCNLRFRYIPAPPGSDSDAWVNGAVSSFMGWVEPDSRVELSLDGLAFLSEAPPRGTLLLTFIHPGTEAAHRVVAEVVRAQPTRRPGVSKVGVHFVRVPPSSGEALADIMLALQEAALEAFAEGSTLDLPPSTADVAEPHE